MVKKTAVFLSVLMISGMVGAEELTQDATQAIQEKMALESQEQNNQLSAGIDLMQQGKLQQAIDGYFNKVIDFFEKKYAEDTAKLYSPSTREESLFYLLTATAKEQNAQIVPEAWGLAYFYKGNVLVELGQTAAAKAALEKAVSLAPMNVTYLFELGHVYQSEQRWEQALELFKKAESADFVPPDKKNAVMGRAKRGMAYSLVELGRLDEAEQKYRECLELNKNDKTALQELQYIQGLRNKMNPKGSSL
jgi:tetratricopeptide (TPR) repeat protein